MSNLNNTNTKLPAEDPKHKRARKSPRLQEKYRQKSQVDNLPTDSQPDPAEILDVGPPTSIALNFLTFFYLFNVLFFGVKDCYENKVLK